MMHLQLSQQYAHRFSQESAVEAVALAGSIATGKHNATSDIDLYIYTNEPLSAEKRLAIAGTFTDHPILNDYWGAGIEFHDPESGIHVDMMFWDTAWADEQLNRNVVLHQASVGYSTCFWHTFHVSKPLFDHNGWFAELQKRANSPYPDELVTAIVNNNLPILRDTPSSLRNQIQKAIERGDVVSINHRVAAFLASYFDILFAINRVLHPGEKRLISHVESSCERVPVDFHEQVTALIGSSGQADAQILDRVDALVAGLLPLIVD